MAVVCHVNQGVLMSNKSVSLRMKRPYSETEGNETNEEEEEETSSFSRHCQAMWSGILSSYPKFLKLQKTTDKYMTAFLRLFDDPKVHDFLWIDSCYKIADKYLLAMVYVYFKRANLAVDRYNAFNFYTALYLANDIEEDDEEDKYEIFPWAMGDEWMKQYPLLLHNRTILWKKMGFRAIVSRRTCEEVIAMAPDHSIWTRHRQRHHGGALRNYMKPSTPSYGRTSPSFCESCLNRNKKSGMTSLRTKKRYPIRTTDFLDDIDLEHTRSNYKSLPVRHHSPYSSDNESHPPITRSQHLLNHKRKEQ